LDRLLEFQSENGQARALAVGDQENIWNWSFSNTQFGLGTEVGQRKINEQWLLFIVFANPTNVEQLTVHTLNAPGRPLPNWRFTNKDARTAYIQFTGDISGFVLDITNQL
jgi:hypothetical protein